MNGVYRAIARVTADLAKEGTSKSRNNAQQGYKFRGIDDIYNALATHLATHQLVILPRIISREVTERQTKSGTPLFYVVVEVEFDFVCAEDGSRHVVKVYGEAMDSADKATNKAMSASYKYACLQTFCIPTEGENDADGTTHELAKAGAKPKTESRPDSQPPAEPKGRPAFSSEAALHTYVSAVRVSIGKCATLDDLRKLHADSAAKLKEMKDSPEAPDNAAGNALRQDFDDAKAKLSDPAKPNVDAILGGDGVKY